MQILTINVKPKECKSEEKLVTSTEPPQSKVTKLKRQIAAAVGVYIKSDHPDIYHSGYFSFRGEDVVDAFCNTILKLQSKFYKLLNTNKPLVMTSKDNYDFNNAENCYYCNEVLGSDRVRDHDHLTGGFRGAAHNFCNQQAWKPNFVPVFFHNLSGYDSHLFIKELAQRSKQEVKLLAKTAEEYISFQVGCLRFLDSYRFLSSSLDNITKNMVDADFKITRSFFEKEDDFKLLRKKGVIPYSYYTSHESFLSTEFNKEMFYNDLKDEPVSDDIFKNVVEFIEHFEIEDHGELVDMYLKSDVLLLADAFERFRDVNLHHFGIDPCWCYSAPGLTWQAGLKYTGVNLELLTDSTMLMWFEKAIRGGVSSVCGDRYCKPDKGQRLLYIDANNLYGWAMGNSLPMSEFEFEEVTGAFDTNEALWTRERIMSLSDEAEVGYYFICDLDYPDSIKFKSKNFPFCPESLLVPDEWLSNYQKALKPKGAANVEKLLLTQTDKKNYIVHYRLLKFYLRQGMVLRKVYSFIKFKQTKWLKPYIEFNTNQRSKATTDFEKDYFKLMNNSYYGKTCENVRNRVEIELVTKRDKLIKLHNNPRFKDEKRFDENLCAVLKRITNIKFDKPIFIGATVLELSKLLMYEFYYDVLQPFYGEKHIQLLYMDTDSFILKVETNDLVNDLYELREHMDFSNYPKDHELFTKYGVVQNKNKKVPGKFKDELGGEEMIEFIALRSKMYAFKTAKGEEKRLKGLSKNVVKKSICFDDYKTCLNENKDYHHKMKMLNSYKHEMFLEEIDKKSLSSYDDKRFILDDGVSTLPYGSNELIG